ncbi:MAG TPA: hypothetical protein VEV81_08430, partial [Pyrinomonadaceae bacterium]|nr:hypothetical protein [Pyrinomonadaceae bacterium]
MLELIKGLQERVTKLETQIAGAVPAKAEDVPITNEGETPPPPPATAKGSQQAEGRKGAGSYTPNLGFKLVDTEYGDLNLSIYTYVRYLNQKGLNPTYEDAFGNIKSVQQRQDIQIQKLQIKFLGWI